MRGPSVFYVTSHGSAGDHWFDWLARALNAHPDVMIYLGETVRSKYLRERGRHERPEVGAFTDFLFDLGAFYEAIGECYAYRSYQLEPVRARWGDLVRMVNVVRHPYCWLTAYVDWRCTNMGMPADQTSGIDHEWNVVRHSDFLELELEPYKRDDIRIWASHQGMHILNRMTTDVRPGVRNVQLEHLVASRDVFRDAISYLTHERIVFDDALLDRVYRWVSTPFRPRSRILESASQERDRWPTWKVLAFERLVSSSARAVFEAHGYVL